MFENTEKMNTMLTRLIQDELDCLQGKAKEQPGVECFLEVSGIIQYLRETDSDYNLKFWGLLTQGGLYYFI